MSFKILSIDGGGIRGILPGTILAYLENSIHNRLKEKGVEHHKVRISDYFDLVAGTSTGGILTCCLLCPDEEGRAKYSAKQAVDVYMENGDIIFSSTFWHKIVSGLGIFDDKYPAETLEKIFIKYFGDIKLSDLIKPCLIPAYDILNYKENFFNSKDSDNPYLDYYVRDVARATSAAPTYFPVANIPTLVGTPVPMIDGGVFANNPSMCALVEAGKFLPKDKEEKVFMLSIGTGKSVKRPPSYSYEQTKGWGALEWIAPLLNIMMSGNSQTVDYQLKKMSKDKRFLSHYYRLQPELVHADSAMDNASKENIQYLKYDAEQFIANNVEMLEELVTLILSE
ncbi:MAG: patatin-like phospholipase family protein [Bacteroidia bacterium]